MKKLKRFINLQLPLIHFSSVMVVLLFLCAEYENPFDPKYEGNYDFSVSGLKMPISLSIFEPLTITMKDTSEVDTFSNYSCVVKDSKVARVEQLKDNKRAFNIFFYNPCKTTLYVNGIRPNEKIVSKEYSVSVENPYRISGDSVLTKNRTGTFRVSRTDNAKISSLIDSIQWILDDEKYRKEKDSSFKVQWNASLKDTSFLSAKLSFNDSASFLLQDTIVFKGFAPEIKNVRIQSYNPSDSNLNQVDSFKVFLECTDYDSNPYTIVIKDENHVLQIKEFNTYTSTCTLLVPPVKKPDTNSLKIIMTDSMGYSDTSGTTVKVDIVVPFVVCPETLTVAVNDTFKFQIDSSINSSSFKWEIIQAGKIIWSDSSTTLSWSILPIDSIGMYILKVTPVNKYNDYVTTDSTILDVKEYAFRTIFSEYKETLNLKVNRPLELKVALEKNSTVESPSGTKYLWSYPENVAKYITKHDSSAVLNFTDVVDSFDIRVQGIVGTDSAQSAVIKVKVKEFASVFSFIDTLYSTKVNQPFEVKIATSLTDPEKSPIKSYLYKVLELKDTNIRSYDSIQGMKIGAVGTFHIEMWCIDKDNTRSNPDTATVIVEADLPYITFSNETLKYAINSPVAISGISVHTGVTKSPVDSVFWKKVDSSSVFKAVKVTENMKIVIDSNGYEKSAIIPFVFKCKDSAGNESTPIEKTIEIFSDIPKIDSFTQNESSKIYEGIPVKFNIAITDPDDESLTLKILGLDTIRVRKVAKNDTFSLIFNKDGVYTLKVVAIDKDNHQSDTVTLGSTLTVDPGNPVVNNFKLLVALPYINDTVRCSVSAVDYNGKIKKYQYYINDTSSVPIEKTDSSVFICTFADSGMKKIIVRVVDDENFGSEFQEISFMVRRGQPVVQNIATDKDSCFVNDSIKFTMTFYDTNGTIRLRQIAWDGDTSILESKLLTQSDAERTVKDSLWHTFSVTDTGSKTIKIRVQDDDSVFSEWKSYTVKIKKGIPKINTIRIISQGVVYVKDSVTLAVAVSDSNKNAIQSVIVSWRNDTSFDTLVFESGSDEFKIEKKFALSDSIIRNIHIKVTDETGMFKDSLHTCIVRIGRPEIDSISLKEVWIKDTNTLKIVARDTNDSELETYMISFDSSKTWSTNSSGVFANIFFNDTSRVGLRLVQVRVLDKDGLWAQKAFSLNVRLGRPVLRQRTNAPNDSIQWVSGNGGRPDTMFFKWSGGLTTIAVGDTDFNGEIQEYYWKWSRLGLIQAPTDTNRFQMNGLTINDTNGLTVTCKDNDSVRSLPYTFFVFPDGPPSAITTTSDAGTGVRIIKWSGKDTKDGNNTLYKIVAKPGTASAIDSVTTADEFNPDYIISDFKTGAQYEIDNAYDFKFNYTPPQSGRIYHYRIIAKDARGAESRTAGDPQFSF